MEKIVKVGDKEYRMRASALIPRIYRAKFKRDLIVDMKSLAQKVTKKQTLTEGATEEEIQDAQLKVIDLEIFENIAWTMMKDAGEPVGNSPEEWLDTIDGIFDVYTVFPAIMELWADTQTTTSQPKNLQGLR